MKKSNTEFNELEALHLIEETIRQARNRLGEDGFIFLLWGWIIMLGSISSYLSLHYSLPEFVGWIWALICMIGGIMSGFYYRNKERRDGKSRMTQIIGYIWGSTGIGAGIMYVFLIINGPQALINPLVLCAAGIATFATGRLIKFTPLIIGGAFFWVFALGTLMIDNELQFLISAASMIPGYLIPGYLLRVKYKKSNVQGA